MKTPTRPFRQWLDRIQRRFVRSRPGSVLILVVALLVLMALIGIAYMTMAQFDRAAAVQHQFNTEVDLLVDGVINQVKAVVTSDVFVNGSFRPGTTQYNVPGGYGYYNATGLALGTSTQNGINASPQYAANPGDAWLASRVPDMLGNLQSPPNATTTPVWPFVSAPINGSALFDTPYWPSGTAVRYARPNNVYNSPFAPGAVVIPGQTSLYPSFNNVPGFGNVLAADADGDGITDSGLVRLLVLDGITYYAAVRIVDNCAAINANIACTPNPLTTVTGSLSTPASAGIPGDFSPVNLDLLDMLASSSELSTLLNYRFNGQTPGLAVDDNGTARNDFAWMGYPTAAGTFYLDQQWAQLGRRLQYPGNVIAGSPAVPTNLFQAMPITESMTMARNFVLRDPSVVSAATSSSILEQALPQTAFNLADSAPYAPNNVGPNPGTWFSDNFNYSTTTETNGGMPMRALLVSRNPVSNFCPGKYTVNTTGPYNFGDMATFNKQKYVCINPVLSTNPPLMKNTASADPHYADTNWAFEPWATAPTKTSVNTATFQQLYAAYWAVMCTTPNVAPFPNAAQPSNQRMFRSPVRLETSPTPSPLLLPLQVLYLRSAIAAVNTMQLRQSPTSATGFPFGDVISRTIQIPPAPGATVTYYATIYGVEKQPYVTQAYAQNNTDPSKDWAAIELFNPYSTAITLTNWQVVAAKRGAGTVTLTAIAPIPTTTIPANSYAVLIDGTPPPASLTLNYSGVPTTKITGLAQKGLGNEVIIMRPRRYDGNFIPASATANNVFNEAAATPASLVPVDCYDFTNMPSTAPPPAPPTNANNAEEWLYDRPSGAGKNWHFVYPGPWNATGGMGAGINPAPSLSATQATSPPLMARTLTFGVGQSAFKQGGFVDVPLQMNNIDFGGPNKSTNAVTNRNVFPYGTFARNGDLLQVPFIGDYKIWTGASITATESSQAIVELNCVTMDSIMATAQDQIDGPAKVGQPIATAAITAENIGRFAPIDTTDSAGVANDFAPPTLPAVNPTTNPLWRYQWSMRLFDFLTVQSPQDDYSPNVDPALADLGYPTTYRYPASATALPTSTANVTLLTANAWSPTGPTAAFNPGNATEETAPVDGLVNINSAPWRVLATVPWLPASNAAYSTTNVTIAKAIAFYRDVDDGSTTTPKHGHGPFKSLFELNEVIVGGVKLRDIQGATSTADYTQAQGNLSPLQGTLDGVIGDFESRFNLVTRISNLVTTRSDSYTAYILVQGWLNAQTANPTLVVQRRAAIIIDRSTVTPASPTPTTVNIPLN